MSEYQPVTPDFIGIGAQRAASTWLSKCLNEHPEICMADPFETHFFGRSHERQQGMARYAQFFEHCSPNVMKGEYTPSYYIYPEIAEDIRHNFPDTKIIVSLRDPIERAVSAYHRAWNQGNINTDFATHIQENMYTRRVQDGFYYHHLSRFLAHFPPDNVHIILYDDIESAPQQVVRSLYAFLGVDPSFSPSALSKTQDNSATGIEYRFRSLNYLVKQRRRITRVPGGTSAKNALKAVGVNEVIKKLQKVNVKGKRDRKKVISSTVDPDTKQALADMYRDDVNQLAQYINRDLSHWLS